MEQNIPQNIQGINHVDENPLHSNVQTVTHGPDKFVLDFIGVYPQFTPDSKPVPVASHKTVILDPYTAKEFLNILQDNIKKYEKRFGEIKKPESLKKAQEMHEIQSSTTKSRSPEYMG